MKKIFLSILISGLILNPLFAMNSNDDPAEIPETKSIQTETNQVVTNTPDVTALSDLAKKIEELTTAVNNVDPSSLNTEETKIQKILAKISSISEKLSPVPGEINKVFNWLSDRLETILTKKGAVKTALILGPIVATYCYCFPPEFLISIVEGMVSATAKGAATISNATAKGLLSGLGQGIKENKEELKKLFLENKEEIKSFVNEIAFEVSKIQAEAQINAEYAKSGAPFSSLSLFGQSTALTAAGGFGAGIAILFKTLIEGIGKKVLGVK